MVAIAVSHGSSFAQGIQVIKVVISITILISEEPFYCFGVFAALLALWSLSNLWKAASSSVKVQSRTKQSVWVYKD